MSKDKYVIKQIINRKPVPMPISELKEDGMFFGIHQNMISQIVEAKNNKEFEFVCSQIQNFIEENNIGVCFAINKNELIDCLQEHQMLKLKISDLEAKLITTEKALQLACRYINCIDVNGFICNGEKNCIDCHNKCHSEKHLLNYFKQQAKEIENE